MVLVNCLRGFFIGKKSKSNAGAQSERLSPRYNISLYARAHGHGAFVERRANIGIGGFCFEGEHEYLPGTDVEILFRLPNTTEWIHARGRVLGHTRKQGWLGIRGHFTGISFENERRLARWIDDMSLQLQQARLTPPPA